MVKRLPILLAMLFLVITLTLVSIPPSSALIQRNYNYLNDNHLTVLTGNTKVCEDHLCTPGEWEKLQESWTAAQLGSYTRNTTQISISLKNFPKTSNELVIPQNSMVLSPTPQKPAISFSVEKPLRLSYANMPVTIPLEKGLYDGKDVYYITTESSDSDTAQAITKYDNFPVTFAPALAKSPNSALSNIYIFKNGVSGSGILGFQTDVFDAIPTESKYSPIWKVNYVEWKDPKDATILGSDDDISNAATKGQVTVTPTNIVVDCPIIKWNGDKEGTVQPGNMMIRDNTQISDTMLQTGGQVLDIDTNNMQATFVAHRGFGPDGSTMYYIVTDASAQEDASDLGIIYANKTASVTSSGASEDYYVFGNGIRGTGSVGYQPGIASAKPGDQTYSPLWLIHRITWNNGNRALLLLDINDIKGHKDQFKISQRGLIVDAHYITEKTVFAQTK